MTEKEIKKLSRKLADSQATIAELKQENDLKDKKIEQLTQELASLKEEADMSKRNESRDSTVTEKNYEIFEKILAKTTKKIEKYNLFMTQKSYQQMLESKFPDFDFSKNPKKADARLFSADDLIEAGKLTKAVEESRDQLSKIYQKNCL